VTLPARRALTGAVLAGLVLLVSGCGTGGVAEGGNAGQGKKIFKGTGRCGSCHTLADAATKGQIGPNLDDAFAAAKDQDFKESTIRNIVLDQIRFPTKGSGMPANLVRGSEAEDVAAYVAKCAASTDKTACPGTAGGGGGKGLYTSLGCQSCHSLDGSPSTGPTFRGLFGSKVKLTNGQTVSADEAFLLESIVDPDKAIVAGFQPGVMTSVIKKGQVSDSDAKKLVAFIKATR
jgi:mono/diheme cytochrome c family protein